MNNTLRKLMDLHEHMKIMMDNEEEQNKKIVAQTNELQRTMTDEIKKDLMELFACYEKLGVSKYIFQSIPLNPLGLKDNKKYYCIGFIFASSYGTGVNICQIIKSSETDCSVSMTKVFSMYNARFVTKEACNIVYSHWKEIKADLEQQIMNAYFDEQKARCEKIYKDRDAAQKILNNIKEIVKQK